MKMNLDSANNNMLKKAIEAIVESAVNSHVKTPTSGLNEAPVKVKKHMSHIYENNDMTFTEMVSIFDKASLGELENVTEKFDGQNMMFTFNANMGQLRFSRNKSDVISGGMSIDSIIKRWEKLPKVMAAFSEAYKALDSAIKNIPRDNVEEIFGTNGNNWFSMEVIYSGNPNVMNYTGNNIVLHKVAVNKDDSSNVITDMSGPNFEASFSKLKNAINLASKKKNNPVWDIHGPVVVNLKKAVNGEASENAKKSLANEIQKYGLSLNNTIGDYIGKAFSEMLMKNIPGMSKENADKLGFVFGTGESISKKKYLASAIDQDVVKVFFKSDVSEKLKNKLIKPIEMIVHDFAVGMLTGVHSALIVSPEEEISRLKNTVAQQISLIKSSSDEKAMEVLSKSLEKLKSVDNITSAIEGITFTHEGNAYKLTGNFAPINQILGLFRF
jgi:hypothetical protein